MSPGPKGGERKAAAVAWEIAKQILEDESRTPPDRHGQLVALARAVQPLLKARGHTREVDTIRKYIRSDLREWHPKNLKDQR